MLDPTLPDGSYAAALEAQRQEALEHSRLRQRSVQIGDAEPTSASPQQGAVSHQQQGAAPRFTDWASI